jgi:hypothetical protein
MRHCMGFFVVAIALLGFASCGEDSFLNRRELADNRKEVTEIMVHVDWNKYADGNPTGMSVYTYGQDGDNERDVSNNVDSMLLDRPMGQYRLLVFNLSTDEFGSMDFHDMDNIDSARAMLTPVTQRQNRTWDKGVTYQREPEALYTAVDTLDFSEQSARVTKRSTLMTDTWRYDAWEQPKPAITRLIIRVRIEAIRNLKSVEGSISGFSSGYYFGRNCGTDSTGTHLLDSWKVTVDSVGAANGYITTTISTFGLPPKSVHQANENVLKLAITLADNTIRVYTLDVGNQFVVLPDDEGGSGLSYQMTLYGKLADITLPTVKPSEEGSGFDAEVDDWDNGGNYDIVF